MDDGVNTPTTTTGGRGSGLSPWWVAIGGVIFGWFGVIAASSGASTVAYLWPLLPLIAVAGDAWRRRQRQ
jgi:hypothetical protein